jgi:glycosyltransferase involved in cell wall biosynthesis
VVALRNGRFKETPVPGVKQLAYDEPEIPKGVRRDELIALMASRRAGKAGEVLREILRSGFCPELICAHIAWGEPMFVKDLVPEAKLLLYCEFFRQPCGTDVGFDPEFSPNRQPVFWTRVANGPLLTCLSVSDAAVAPTLWQRSTFPTLHRDKIRVIHDGVDTDAVIPQADATFQMNGKTFSGHDEIVTYVSRSLEPHRGFPTFMRAIPQVQHRRPRAQIIILGREEVTYSPVLLSGESYRAHMLRELGDELDMSRVHFSNGVIPHGEHIKLLQISSVHAHLTYPFVQSWSLIEAMSAGCLVVGSRTPPVQEAIVDGENGLLVDFFSPEELAEKIAAALERPRDMQPLREAARRTAVERYDLARVCLPQQLSLIEEVMRCDHRAR